MMMVYNRDKTLHLSVPGSNPVGLYTLNEVDP
jgi:hypothetical protein